MTQPAWKIAEEQRLAAKFDTDATVINGVVRWNSNGRVPPNDVLLTWEQHGKQFDIKASRIASNTETQAFLAEYRRNPPKYSEEARAEMEFEMRANGINPRTAVNALTGRRVF